MWGGNVLKAISQDIKAAITAFEKEDYELMVIFANRIMSDALFADDRKLALRGFFLRHVAQNYIMFKDSWSGTGIPSNTVEAIKEIGKRYIMTLSDLDSTDELRLWKDFQEYDNNDLLRKWSITDIERSVYEDDFGITHEAFKWLVNYLGENKDLLLQMNNRLLDGILSEMGRFLNLYGGELTDLYIVYLVIAFRDYYRYFKRAFGKVDEGIPREKAEEGLFNFVEEIVKLKTSAQEVKAEEVNKILWTLIKGWREFFIQYMERPRRRRAQPLMLPEEYKRKLTESITKTLEK